MEKNSSYKDVVLVDGTNVDLVKLRYVQSNEKPSIMNICNDFNILNFKYVEKIARDEMWEKQRIAYINDEIELLKTINRKEGERVRKENSTIIQNLMKASYKQLVGRIQNNEEKVSIKELCELGKLANEISGTKENNNNNINVDKAITVVLNKPLNDMTLEELEEASDMIKEELV